MSVAACALALVLAIDVSGSVTPPEYDLQREGIVSALASSDVKNSLAANFPMAIEVVQWSTVPEFTIPWTIVNNEKEFHVLIQRIRTMTRPEKGETYMGVMLRSVIASFANVPCTPERSVIDVSGDGKDSHDLNIKEDRHAQPKHSYVPEMVADAEAKEIQINGLPILNPHEFYDQDVVEYYEKNVKTSDGFVIKADGFDDVERAMRGKLVNEIAGLFPRPRG